MSENNEVTTVQQEVEVTEGLALAFSKYFLEEKDALKACFKIWTAREDSSYALKMSAILPKHPLIIEAIKNSKDNTLIELPTKDEFSQKLWSMVDAAESDDAKVKFMKLYADARGFIEKQAENINNQSVTVVLPRCIEIPSHGSDDDWEKQLAIQQSELMKRAKGRT